MNSKLKYIFGRTNVDEFSSYIEKNCSLARPGECPGFRFANPMVINHIPIEGVHYDAQLQKPITLLCKHDGECQPYAEYLYVLVHAFAFGDIDSAQWASIFPTRNKTGNAGFPKYASYYGTPKDLRKTCPGYQLCLGPCTNTVEVNIPNILRKGYEMNPTTNTPYTKSCNHNNCDVTAPYKFALFTLYYNGMLRNIDPHDTIPSFTDVNYVIKTHGWIATYTKSGEWYRDIIKDINKWPGNKRLFSVPSFMLWDPATLVSNTDVELFNQGGTDTVDRVRRSTKPTPTITVRASSDSSDDEPMERELSSSPIQRTDIETSDPVVRAQFFGGNASAGPSTNYAPSAPPLEETTTQAKRPRVRGMQFDDEEEAAAPGAINLYQPQTISLYGTRAWLTNQFAPMVHLKRKMPKPREQREQVESSQQQRDYYLNFRLDQDAPGLIEYMAMYAAEVKNPQLNANMIQVLQNCLTLVKNPSKLAEYRAKAMQNKPREQQLRL